MRMIAAAKIALIWPSFTRSGYFIGPAQAGDHGGIEKVLAGACRVAGEGHQVLHVLALHLRIALLEHALVADRHGLHLLDGGGTALAHVAIEERLVGFAAPHL